MKITEEVRRYAIGKGLEAEAALAAGMAEKSREFVEQGAEVYRPR
jgi:phosphomethylpyrimidine synthase